MPTTSASVKTPWAAQVSLFRTEPNTLDPKCGDQNRCMGGTRISGISPHGDRAGRQAGRHRYTRMHLDVHRQPGVPGRGYNGHFHRLFLTRVRLQAAGTTVGALPKNCSPVSESEIKRDRDRDHDRMCVFERILLLLLFLHTTSSCPGRRSAAGARPQEEVRAYDAAAGAGWQGCC